MIDPCVSYQNLTDNWRALSVSGQSNPRCDNNLVANWYRFWLNDTNAYIVTNPPAILSCGTSGPLWWDGSYNIDTSLII